MNEETPKDLGCESPPPGWFCTQSPGHEGPCTALPKPESVWRHVKTRGKYKLIGVARRDADAEMVVVYESLQDHRWWTRPIVEFFERFVVEGA